jgi:hypothetical protein
MRVAAKQIRFAERQQRLAHLYSSVCSRFDLKQPQTFQGFHRLALHFGDVFRTQKVCEYVTPALIY